MQSQRRFGAVNLKYYIIIIIMTQTWSHWSVQLSCFLRFWGPWRPYSTAGDSGVDVPCFLHKVFNSSPSVGVVDREMRITTGWWLWLIAWVCLKQRWLFLFKYVRSVRRRYWRLVYDVCAPVVDDLGGVLGGVICALLFWVDMLTLSGGCDCWLIYAYVFLWGQCHDAVLPTLVIHVRRYDLSILPLSPSDDSVCTDPNNDADIDLSLRLSDIRDFPDAAFDSTFAPFRSSLPPSQPRDAITALWLYTFLYYFYNVMAL
jgi:hypothetical protein